MSEHNPLQTSFVQRDGTGSRTAQSHAQRVAEEWRGRLVEQDTREDGIREFVDPNPDRLDVHINADARAVENDGDDLVEISITSEYPVIDAFGEREIISHDPRDMRLNRLMEVGAILKNHDPRQIVAVPERVWLDEETRKTKALIRFGTTPEAQTAKHEVLVDKTLRGVSGGFLTRRWLWLEDESIKFNDRISGPAWIGLDTDILEASLTPIPADPSVGVNRTQQRRGNTTMKKKLRLLLDHLMGVRQYNAGDIIEVDEREVAALTSGDAPIAEIVADEPVTRTEVESVPRAAAPAPELTAQTTETPEQIASRLIVAERVRCSEINALGARFNTDVADFVNSEATVDQVRGHLLDVAESRLQSVPTHGSDRVEFGSDQRDKFARQASTAMRLRAGHKDISDEDRREAQGSVGGLSLVRLAEECLKIAGIPFQQGNREQIVSLALRGDAVSSWDLGTRAAESITIGTSDFPLILADTANKAMLMGADLANPTYQEWCKIGNANDFKNQKRIKMSEVGKLVEIPEFGTYPTTKIAEEQETLAVVTYGNAFNLSRQAIVNDDLDAFTTIPMKLGHAAGRLPNDLAVTVLLSNPTMTNGNALFSSGNSNISDDESAYALTSIEKARAGIANLVTIMMQQTAYQHGDVTGEQMNLRLSPVVGLFPSTGWEWVRAVLGETGYGTGVEGVNPLQNIVKPHFEPSLEDSNITGNSTTGYYLFASTLVAPVIEVAFLGGNQTPFMEEVENNGTAADGRVWKVRHDCGAAAIDFRGAVKEVAVS